MSQFVIAGSKLANLVLKAPDAADLEPIMTVLSGIDSKVDAGVIVCSEHSANFNAFIGALAE